MARSIVFDPLNYGGLCLPHLYTLQSLGQLTLFLGHLRVEEKMSKLICISLMHLQLLIGSTQLVLTISYKPYGNWVEKGWLTSLWQFLIKVNLHVRVTNSWTPFLTREHEIALMNYFLTQKYNAMELSKLNCCHLYLQVITFANIATADRSNSCLRASWVYLIQIDKAD